MSTLNNIFQGLLRNYHLNFNDAQKNIVVTNAFYTLIKKLRKQILLALTPITIFICFFTREIVLALYSDTLNNTEKNIFTVVVGAILALLATRRYMKSTKKEG